MSDAAVYSHDSDPSESLGSGIEFAKVPIFIALGLALCLVIGVLIGAKAVYDRVAQQPVALAALDTPEAASEQCATLVKHLPDTLEGFPRAEIVAPVPPGTAVWRKSSTEQITLRCGVQLPLQYSALSETIDVNGVQWLPVMDTTPSSTLQTWYTVNLAKVVAVTTDDQGFAKEKFPVAQLGEALSKLDLTQPQPYPLPLADLPEDPASAAACKQVMQHLPATLGDSVSYTRRDIADQPLMAAWVAQGYEPIVLRCGVEFPQHYQPGARLHQVDEMVWFEDTLLGNGTTASYWYGLGRTHIGVISAPQDSSAVALVSLGKILTQHFPADNTQLSQE
ncbi:DUF3515 domain-containing protein [Corynebacterium sp. HS2168-gen11]|uniref:DUF3515 domain-containing protein n=1 Tax=Corynebacterium sp. HS2168-gen11 TaxID=2974027 RepID=UPI00216B4F08|nr:DUF3515 domain-containing protein [Corynebacterium sp. HS2168-gen11]MCS4534801.1 DUF3515 domain-containing protein [Corynebacterium sp. HS2168-gen11]